MGNAYRKLTLFFLLALATLVSGQDVLAQVTLASVRQAGVLRHAVGNSNPHGYIDASGQAKGYEVEILQRVSQKLGIPKVETIVTKFGALIPGLKAGRFDVISDGMYIKSERCEQVRFTDPHTMLGEGAVVLKGNPKKVRGIEELAKDRSIRIGITTGGATHKTFLMAGGQPDQIFEFADRSAMAAALKAGRIDVALVSAMGALGLYKVDPNFELVTDFRQYYDKSGKPVVNYVGFGFRPEDKELADAFNREIQAFMKTDEYREILKRYEVSSAMIPAAGTTAEAVCRS